MTIKQLEFILMCIDTHINDLSYTPDKEESQVIQELTAQLKDRRTNHYHHLNERSNN